MNIPLWATTLARIIEPFAFIGTVIFACLMVWDKDSLEEANKGRYDGRKMV